MIAARPRDRIQPASPPDTLPAIQLLPGANKSRARGPISRSEVGERHRRTVSMPHYMPYATFITNEDIGAAPSLDDPSSLYHPVIDREGIDEQSYLIHLVGQKERDQILADEQELLAELCAYRDVLCDPQTID
ncbi:hypothetical protein [Paracoccus alkanivorans]|nr:hypothetical protein [Paracoccus alkanivorans]